VGALEYAAHVAAVFGRPCIFLFSTDNIIRISAFVPAAEMGGSHVQFREYFLSQAI